MEIEEIVREKFKETLEIYQAEGFDENGLPVLCRIHDAFGGMKSQKHNCLGCNFADSQNLILNVLLKYESYEEIAEPFTLYIISVYLLAERMDTVMDMVQVPTPYRDKYFKVMQQIRKWANFIKHPKAFILTHHPDYDFENSGIEFDKPFQEVINDTFVEKFYKGERDPDKQKARNKELYNKLKNKKDIHVIFPDIAQLTKKLCYSIKSFSDLILKNQVYIDILNDDATIENYFENQSDES